MSSSYQNSKKIINSFLVVGINKEKIQKYNLLSTNEEPQLSFIQNIDMINMDVLIKKNNFEISNEKWIKILNNPYCWIRYQYETNYISPITHLQIFECDIYNKEFLLLPKNLYDDGYRPAPITYYYSKNNKLDFREIPRVTFDRTSFNKLDKYNILIPMKYNCKNVFGLHNKNKGALLLINRKKKYLPLKEVTLQNTQNGSFNFCIRRHKSPYSYKYFPEILDKYPFNEKKNPSIALFCFPDGIKITENFETPKCFNFVLTDELGERTYGAVLIFSQEINNTFKEMFIPNYSPDGKTFYMQKAICILSNFPFYYNSLLFLKEIYKITEPKSFGNIPIERAIGTFVDLLYLPPNDKLLRFNINNNSIDFYRIPNYGKIWDTNDKYLETLFRLLSFDIIITAWEGLLLEKKLYIVCNSKNVLSHITHALINLLFPFNWIHVYVPILPEQLKLFIESPVPLIIGIFFHIEINELPQDSLILNVNKNCFENYKEKLPPLPPKLNKILLSKLSKLKAQYKLDNPINTENWIANQDEALIYLGPDTLLFPKIDTCEIRDAFYSVFLAMFKNYGNYFSFNNNITGIENVFLKENFLRDHNSLEPNSFLDLFCETTLFSQFVNAFCVEQNNINSSFAFFIENIKKGKGKNKYYLEKIIPQNVIFAPGIEISDLKGKIFNYPEFPVLNKNLFIMHEVPKAPYKSKFSYSKDEWCYSPENLKKKDWPKYFLYLIYDIWFTLFSFVLNIYEDNQAIIMMDYALFLVEYLNNNLKVTPSRTLFSKIIKACARNALNPFVKQILILVKNINKDKSRFNSLFHNDYLNGLYFLTENVNTGITRDSLTNSSLLKNTMRASVINEMRKTDNDIKNKLKKIIFLTYNLCENCLSKLEKIKCVSYEEILAGFIMKKPEENKTVCYNCLNLFEPKIFFIESNQNNLDLKEINFLSPMQLVNRIDNIIKEKGEISFYKENDWNEVYWNIIFYFELFDLPTCVLYVQNNMDKFEKLKNELKENRKRKLNQEKEKKNQKKNFFFGKLNRNNKNKSKENVMEFMMDHTKSDSNVTNFSENNISDFSLASIGKQDIFTNMEMDIWKMYQIRKNNNKNEIKDINNPTTEDKNEILSKISETKGFLKDILSYFCQKSQEKLRIFLEKYNKDEMMKKQDYGYMLLKNENDKYINNDIKNSDKFTINANLNFKINRKDILQIEKEQNLQKNILKQDNRNNTNIINKETIPMKYNSNTTGNNNHINLLNNNNVINTTNQMAYMPNNDLNKNIYQRNPNANLNIPNYNIMYGNTYSNNNLNNNYQNPTNANKGLRVKTPTKTKNYFKNQINPNNAKIKQYTVRQINTYKSIYDKGENI